MIIINIKFQEVDDDDDQDHSIIMIMMTSKVVSFFSLI